MQKLKLNKNYDFCITIRFLDIQTIINGFIICLHKARFPFLDEDVIRILLDIPLWEIADLNQPSGTGDKKILREVSLFLFSHLFC